MCFLVGTKPEKNESLKLLLNIEYLKFNFNDKCKKNEEKYIEITNDFMIHNSSDRDASLYCIHMGNIHFEFSHNTWLTDEWTSILRKYAAADIGLNISDSGIISLANKNIGYYEKFGFFQEENKIPNETNGSISNQRDPNVLLPFVCIKTPPIKPNENKIFRLKGILRGSNYDNMMKDYEEHNSITVKGGYPLLETIIEDLKKPCYDNTDEYIRFLEDFHMQRPKYYIVFLEDTNRKPFRYYNLSTDVFIGEENLKHRKRIINWYWSDSDFTLSANAATKGPILRMFRNHF